MSRGQILQNLPDVLLPPHSALLPQACPETHPLSLQILCARSLPHTASSPLQATPRTPFPPRTAASAPQSHMTSEPTVPPLRHAPAPAAPPPPLFANTPAAHQSRCRHLLPARQSVAPPDRPCRWSYPKPPAPLPHSATSANQNPFPT